MSDAAETPEKPAYPTVTVKTDGEGVTEAVFINGYELPNALVDIDLHLGRVTLVFPAKVVVL